MLAVSDEPWYEWPWHFQLRRPASVVNLLPYVVCVSVFMRICDDETFYQNYGAQRYALAGAVLTRR
jgi:hypothetical protein